MRLLLILYLSTQFGLSCNFDSIINIREEDGPHSHTSYYFELVSGGSVARPSPSPSPVDPIFFQFHAVFGKIWQNHMLAPPPPEGWRPHLGEILDPPLLVIGHKKARKTLKRDLFLLN